MVRRARQAAELLLAREGGGWGEEDLFDPKAPPPVAILVSGGKCAADAADRIGKYIKAAKQRGNFHSVLILEPGACVTETLPDGRFSVTVKPLGSPP